MLPACAQFYQGSQMSFGKNRVQYNDFYWTFYRFKNYDVYFYVGGKEHAAYVGKQAQFEIDFIEKTLDYRSTSRMQFIIYNKLSELKQTNIGLELDDQLYNIGGLTRIVGNKVLLYFNGDHINFNQQIRAGVAHVLLDQLMYGGSLKDRLQASILLNLPDWFTKGLVSYLSRGWSADDENKLRDAIANGRIHKFNKLIETDEVFAGHSFWKFISDTYGQSTLSNVVYMTRINRSIENGFVFVVGSSVKQLSANWLTYYQNRYLNYSKNKNKPAGTALGLKEKHRTITQLKLSPDGNKLAYATNDIGKYRAKIFDIPSGRKKRIDRGGYKSNATENDKSFPLLAWHPIGKIIAIVKEKKGKLWLNFYNTETRKTEQTQLLYFTKILDLTYSPDGQKLVFSAVQKGQSDIYLFNIRGRNYEQLTDDVYDDLSPHFFNSSTQLVFSSNRSNDTLGVDVNKNPMQQNFDLFLLDAADRKKIAVRITQSPEDEFNAQAYDASHFAYLSDKNGIVNRMIAEMDSTISFVDTTEHYRYYFRHYAQTNYAYNALQSDINAKKSKHAELFLHNGRYHVYVNPLLAFDKSTSFILNTVEYARPASAGIKSADSLFLKFMKEDVVVADTASTVATDTNTTKVDINNYIFQSEFKPKKKNATQEVDSSSALINQPIAEPTNTQTKQDTTVSLTVIQLPKDSITFRLPKQRNYDLAFSPDYLITQLDNSLFNSTYQSYTGGAVYFDPGLNLLLKVGMSDLMNDVKITGGIRVSGDFNSNEYLALVDLMKGRMDKQIMFYRQARIVTTDDNEIQKVHTHDIKFVNKYPLNDLTALKGTIDLRTDRTAYLSTDVSALKKPNETNYWISPKLEYIFDNTIKKGLNLYNGMRYKLFAEMFYKINSPHYTTYIAGFDVRHYQKVHRQIIWANRFSASSSFGKQKLLYYLGSEDNAIVPGSNFNYNISIDNSQHYVFQTLASPMRGFKQNIRNGNSFALFNSEIRMPLFQYILNRPIRSDFVRNFQVVGFFDAGTAWTGKSPYGDENSLNVQTVNQGPVTVTVIKQIQPIVAGYGFGLRTRVFGYFVRADWAYGIDDKQIQPVIFYLSLGLDF